MQNVAKELEGLLRKARTVPRRVRFRFPARCDDPMNKGFDLSFCNRGVHAGEFQTLASVDTGVADHCFSLLEEALADRGVDAVGVFFALWDEAEDHRAELRGADQFEWRSFADHIGRLRRQFDGAVDHRGKLFAA